MDKNRVVVRDPGAAENAKAAQTAQQQRNVRLQARNEHISVETLFKFLSKSNSGSGSFGSVGNGSGNQIPEVPEGLSMILNMTEPAEMEEPEGAPQPKRSKKGEGSTHKGKNIDVQRDSDNKPVMPIEINKNITILSLGKIVTEPPFHTKRYIWPVGFKSVRKHMSINVLNNKALYTNEIIEENGRPMFQVTYQEEGHDNVVFKAETSSGVWTQINKRIMDCREASTGRRTFTQLSGPEMYGYGIPAIGLLLEEMPEAAKLEKYEFQFLSEDQRPERPAPPPPPDKRKDKEKKEKKEVKEEKEENERRKRGRAKKFEVEDGDVEEEKKRPKKRLKKTKDAIIPSDDD